MKRLVCIGFLFAALGMIVAAPAQSASRFRVQTFINPDGTGQMFASAPRLGRGKRVLPT